MTINDWSVVILALVAYIVGVAGGWLLARARYVRAVRDWQALAEQLDVENELLADEVEAARAACRTFGMVRPLRAVKSR